MTVDVADDLVVILALLETTRGKEDGGGLIGWRVVKRVP